MISYCATHLGGERLPGIESMVPADVLEFVEHHLLRLTELIFVSVTAWAFVRGRLAVQVIMISPKAAADPAFPLFEYLADEALEAFSQLARS